MNIYYHKKVGLNIKYFWKEILKFVPGLIIPIICGVAIKCFIGIHNIFMFIILGIMYTIIFVVSVWFIGMNEYEKSLLESPLNKIKSKFILRR